MPAGWSVTAPRLGRGYAPVVPHDAPTTPPRPDAVVIRAARTADVRAIRALVAPLAERRVLLNKEAVAYYESVTDFVVAEARGQVVGCGALHVFVGGPRRGAHPGGRRLGARRRSRVGRARAPWSSGPGCSG